jgi:SnoaL-like domain
MNRPFVLFPVAVVLTVLASTGGVSAQTDPVSVLQNFQDARNAGDLDGVMALVAPDASYVGGPACPPENPCVGIDAMRANVQRYIAGHEQATIVGTPQVSGSVVKARLESRNPDRLAIGVERTLSDVTAEVRDRQLVSWASTSDASDPQTAVWLAFQRGQQLQPTPPAENEQEPSPR